MNSSRSPLSRSWGARRIKVKVAGVIIPNPRPPGRPTNASTNPATIGGALSNNIPFLPMADASRAISVLL